jgi:DNA-binding transcriptional ArsR family regulator
MPLTSTFAALADPTRLAIVTRLSRGEATMGELAAPHRITLPAMTKHVGVLVDAGMVKRHKVGRSVVCYCPNPELELKVDADVRVGGLYVVTMGPHVVRGSYTELENAGDVKSHVLGWEGDLVRLPLVLAESA